MDNHLNFKIMKIDKIYLELRAIVKWFAGFLEDQKGGSGSSKRAALYAFMLMMGFLVKQSPSVPKESYQSFQMALWTIGVIILFLLGFITSEFFKTNSFPLITPPKSKED